MVVQKRVCCAASLVEFKVDVAVARELSCYSHDTESSGFLHRTRILYRKLERVQSCNIADPLNQSTLGL